MSNVNPAGEDSSRLDVIVLDSNGRIRQAERASLAVHEERTSERAFFIAHHYDAPPELDTSAWQLSITGRVQRPLTLGWGELQALSESSVRCVLECSGNSRRFASPRPPGTPFRNGVLAQPEWTGVPLARLLHAAGLGQGATTIVVRGRDGTRDHSFAKGLPLHKALHPDTLLATHLNGQPLTHLRGGPARLAVPGWFGIWSVKWVDAIEVHSGPYDGYWQTARYVYRWLDDRPTTPLMELPVKSLIAQPREGQRFQPGPIEISGYAWSGQGRIASVDVRIGDGEWTSAQLSQPKSQWAWCRWDYAWNNAPPGRHAIASRARDDTGREQPAQMDWNELGYANNAVQPVVVDISPG